MKLIYQKQSLAAHGWDSIGHAEKILLSLLSELENVIYYRWQKKKFKLVYCEIKVKLLSLRGNCVPKKHKNLLIWL